MSETLNRTLTVTTAVDTPVWLGKISLAPTLDGELQSCSGMSLFHLNLKRMLPGMRILIDSYSLSVLKVWLSTLSQEPRWLGHFGCDLIHSWGSAFGGVLAFSLIGFLLFICFAVLTS